MNLPIKYLGLVLFLIFSLKLSAQKIINPVINAKTHSSLRIDSIILNENESYFYLEIVNENSEGTAWFCADADIRMIELDSGKEHKLLRSEKIPVCPDVHQFSSPGENLSFILIFPALNKDVKEIDLIEQCSDNCFSLKGILLDPVLNKEIRIFENGVELYQNKHFSEALFLFESLKLSDYVDENHYAYTLYILPILYQKTGKNEEALKAYRFLYSSEILQKQYFMKKLNEIEYFRDLQE